MPNNSRRVVGCANCSKRINVPHVAAADEYRWCWACLGYDVRAAVQTCGIYRAMQGGAS